MVNPQVTGEQLAAEALTAAQGGRAPGGLTPSWLQSFFDRASWTDDELVDLLDVIDKGYSVAEMGLGEQWNRKYGRRLDLGPPE